MLQSQKIFDEKKLLTQAKENNSLHATIVDHPLVRNTLSVMRNKKTNMHNFSAAVEMLTYHLIFTATQDLNEKAVKIETPLAPIKCSEVSDQVVLVPVLRSGNGMLGPARAIFPDSTVIYAGVKRDEATALPNWYRDLDRLESLNSGEGSVFLILDPMLATGGSAIEVAKRIKSVYPHGRIKMIAMISAPEGIQALNKAFPEVEIVTAAVDDHLNDVKYIIPGLGDAGDRQFGTI